MSKFLIAFYMGVVSGHNRDIQALNYDHQGRFRQSEQHDPVPDLDCVQHAGGDFANQQKEDHSATGNAHIRYGTR